MYKFLLNYFSERFLSRWIVLAFDVFMLVPIFYVSYLIRFGFDVSEVQAQIDAKQIIFVVLLYLVTYFGDKTLFWDS